MTSLYDMTVLVFVPALENLKHVLSVGEKHANEHGMEPKKLIEARLIDDMNVKRFQTVHNRDYVLIMAVQPLPFQVQSASDTAKVGFAINQID